MTGDSTSTPQTDPLRAARQVAEQIAKEAGAILLEGWGTRPAVGFKSEDINLVTEFPYARNPVQTNLPEWNALTAAAQGTRRLGSAALDLCFVACGWLDGYWERALHPWDLVGGAAIVQAAGGRVSDLDGGTFD